MRATGRSDSPLVGIDRLGREDQLVEERLQPSTQLSGSVAGGEVHGGQSARSLSRIEPMVTTELLDDAAMAERLTPWLATATGKLVHRCRPTATSWFAGWPRATAT